MWDYAKYTFLTGQCRNIMDYPTEVLIMGVGALWGMTIDDMAEWLGVTKQECTRYILGQKEIPYGITLLMRLTIMKGVLYAESYMDCADSDLVLLWMDAFNLRKRKMSEWLHCSYWTIVHIVHSGRKMHKYNRLLLEAMIQWKIWLV